MKAYAIINVLDLKMLQSSCLVLWNFGLAVEFGILLISFFKNKFLLAFTRMGFKVFEVGRGNDW